MSSGGHGSRTGRGDGGPVGADETRDGSGGMGMGDDMGLDGDMSGDGDIGRVSWAEAGRRTEDGEMGRGGAKRTGICAGGWSGPSLLDPGPTKEC